MATKDTAVESSCISWTFTYRCGACNGIGLKGTRQKAHSASIVVHGGKGTLGNYSRTFEV